MPKQPRHTRQQSRHRRAPKQRTAPPTYLCEAEVAPGLEDIARAEIERRFGQRASLWHAPHVRPRPGVIRFDYRGDLSALLCLQTVQSVYLVRYYAVPRPRALLGDEHFRALLAQIALVRSLHPPQTFQTLYIGAAGSDSSIMTRLKDQLAHYTGLIVASHEGDLLLRLRRSLYSDQGWEALVRLSPRPLATRPWRVCNLQGALNATVAHAMALLTSPTPRDVFLNLACGSGALLIERLQCTSVRRAIGCDINSKALDCARANIEASGHSAHIELRAWDARILPLPPHSIDALCSDLPFGNLVGSHQANLALYPDILQEAARVAKLSARFVLISHEVRLMEEVLGRSTGWVTEKTLHITLGGLHPRIFVLRKA